MFIPRNNGPGIERINLATKSTQTSNTTREFSFISGSPNGQYLAAQTVFNALYLASAPGYSLAFADTTGLEAYAWSSDSRFIAYPTRSATLVRELASGRMVASFGAASYATPLAFSPDGKSLLLGSGGISGTRILLWQLASDSASDVATVLAYRSGGPYRKNLLGCWSTSGPTLIYEGEFLVSPSSGEVDVFSANLAQKFNGCSPL
jgi:hypothetical protein